MAEPREAPKRIRRERRKGWRKPDNCVIVDRTSRYGNPWSVKQGYARDECYSRFETYLVARRNQVHSWPNAISYPSDEEIRADLAGKSLACPCPLPADGEPDRCHAALLISLANEVPDA